MSAHTQGPWRAGRGCVVADHPVPEMNGSDAVDYYGGHLIAESIAPQNIPPIAAAPELLTSLQDLIQDERFGTDSYCEVCQRHAPKDDAGHVIGKVVHREDCMIGRAGAAITKATGAAA